MDIESGKFIWDEEKNKVNQAEKFVSFEEAKEAFSDPDRCIFPDKAHSTKAEKRYFCIGEIERGVVTVRFTYRGNKIRIYGAGFWREGYRKYMDYKERKRKWRN
jgi:uncharacterized DUF497 family protein